ncbi:Nn.00g050120.m01.CDS01 [Neocucurbitaria sp. VM-36]
MVAKGKRNAANQHDKRHENGLAAPGKRITKQKSNPQLNGHAHAHAGSGRTQTQPSPPPPPLLLPPSHVDNAVAMPARSAAVAVPGQGPGASASVMVDTHTTTTAAAAEPAVDPRARTRARAVSDVSLDNVDCCDNTGSGPFDPVPTPRRVDANGSKTASFSMASMLAVPATILTSCPLRDVLAILIILLQLPPTVLTVIQFLFATLTFVPPQAGTPLSALSAFPSFTDIFQGSGGTPSLFTTIFADAFILVIWLILWVPVQNFFLDLAQAVIAIALGGAAAGKNGTTNSIFICFIIILSNHLFRFRPLRQHIVHFLWTGLARGGLEFLTSPPSAPTFLESFSTPHGWPRSLLGIHILAQGVVRIIRRSLSRRDVASTLPTGKKADPEAGVLQRVNSTTLDPNADVPNSSSTDGRPPGPSPAAHAHKDKASSSRRKRKQATHVRSQQPFWAALASTKVTVLKEMESSRAANDADEANAKDANHIGNAVWRSEDDRVWISEVGYSDISFCVSLFSSADFQEQGDEDSGVGSGIDKSKPFYIRVNGADWSSTRIRQSTPLGYQGQEGTGFWLGEIFGLTALSNYYCEFVRTTDNEVFYSASLITSASPVTELASVASPPAHQTLRPSSPTTTLKNSIAAADQQLQEHRNRLKRNKKDHKTAISNIKKEVDTLSNRLANAGGTDERQRQRVLQFTQNIRQADDAAAEFAVQAGNLGGIPEDEAQEAATKKAQWKKERDNKNAVCGEFDNIKADIERQVQSVESDISAALQKRERLQQRQTRLNEQHDRLVTANEEGFTAKQRREQERAALRQQRADVENQYRSNINGYERRTEEHNVATTQIMQTIQHYEDMLLQQHQQVSVPTTPEGPLPGTSMSPHANAFTSFTFPSLNTHVSSTPGSLRGGRGRSSSMLSNVSGFTDGFDEPTSPSGYVLGNPFNTPGMLNGHNGSHGSGSLSSGTSSQSSSQKDPMSPYQSVKPMMVRSPTGGSAGLMSPIGSGR